MKDTFHFRNPGPSVAGYSLDLFTVLKSLPVLLTDAVSEAAMLDPVNYGYVSGLLKALPSTMAVLFPRVTSHPSISIVCSMLYTWSVRCCPSLCFVDMAQQHPCLWKGLLDIPQYKQTWIAEMMRGEQSWKGTWGFRIAVTAVKIVRRSQIQQSETWFRSPHLRLWSLNHLVRCCLTVEALGDLLHCINIGAGCLPTVMPCSISNDPSGLLHSVHNTQPTNNLLDQRGRPCGRH